MQTVITVLVLCCLASLVPAQEDISADKRLSRFAFAKRAGPRMFAFAKRADELYEDDDDLSASKRARFAFAKRFAFAGSRPYGFAFAKRASFA